MSYIPNLTYKLINRFNYHINQLGYDKLKVKTIDPIKIETWCKTNMPKVVEELYSLGWDLNDSDTWLETVFSNLYLRWYEKNIMLFLTTSYLDYELANKVLHYPAFYDYRKEFGIDAHVSVLADVNKAHNLRPEDIDSIYLCINPKTKIGSIDLAWNEDQWEKYTSVDNTNEDYYETVVWVNDN